MEHREPLRVAPVDRRLDASVESSREFGPRRAYNLGLIGITRRGDPRRLALLLAAGVATLVAVAYVASLGTAAAVAWLHRQPYYHVSFDRICVEPSPPLWYRGGVDAFLDAVRRSARQSKPIARLDLAPDELASMFKNYPWVEGVRVRYLSDRIVVNVRYRQPVAYVQTYQGEQLLVDEKATILPSADVDESRFAPVRLARITAQRLDPPADQTPGVSWKTRSKNDDVPRDDPRIRAAAKLAGFLRSQAQSQSSTIPRAIRIGEIIVTVFDKNDRGLFVLNDEGQTIWWRQAPGEERPGEPKASEKWEMLRKWCESGKKRTLPEHDYWAFSATELLHVCPEPGHPHLTKTAAESDTHAESDTDANSQRKVGGP